MISVVLSTISGLFSLCGAFVIFGTYVAIPEIRNFTRKLIVCLTIADLLTATGVIISTGRYLYKSNNATITNSVCLAQSVITTYSSLVSFFLTVAVGGYLFLTVIYHWNVAETRTVLIVINLVCWLVPGAIVIAALSKDVLGEDTSKTSDNMTQPVGTGPWCWIKDAKNNKFWMWFSGKSWEIICYMLTISFYVLLKFYQFLKSRYQSFSTIHATLRNEDQNFVYVWLILYLLRIWGTIRFVFFVIYNLNPGGWLLYLHAVGDPGQAFGNFILFCVFDRTVRTRMLKCYKCCNKSKQYIKLYSVTETGNDDSVQQSSVLLSI